MALSMADYKGDTMHPILKVPLKKLMETAVSGQHSPIFPLNVGTNTVNMKALDLETPKTWSRLFQLGYDMHLAILGSIMPFRGTSKPAAMQGHGDEPGGTYWQAAMQFQNVFVLALPSRLIQAKHMLIQGLVASGLNQFVFSKTNRDVAESTLDAEGKLFVSLEETEQLPLYANAPVRRVADCIANIFAHSFSMPPSWKPRATQANIEKGSDFIGCKTLKRIGKLEDNQMAGLFALKDQIQEPLGKQLNAYEKSMQASGQYQDQGAELNKAFKDPRARLLAAKSIEAILIIDRWLAVLAVEKYNLKLPSGQGVCFVNDKYELYFATVETDDSDSDDEKT